jgi:hypothetical protein
MITKRELFRFLCQPLLFLKLREMKFLLQLSSYFFTSRKLTAAKDLYGEAVPKQEISIITRNESNKSKARKGKGPCA